MSRDTMPLNYLDLTKPWWLIRRSTQEVVQTFDRPEAAGPVDDAHSLVEASEVQLANGRERS
jgi:hypothetical protein